MDRTPDAAAPIPRTGRRRHARSRGRGRTRDRSRPRYAHAKRRAPRWPQRLLVVAGCVAIVAGLVVAGGLADFYRHSATVGSALIHREQRSAARIRTSGHCVAGFPSTGPPSVTGSLPVPDPAVTSGSVTVSGATPTPYALLTAQGIGLDAPIVEGIDGAELDVAVGHVPASAWPGVTGTSVLAAHDVTWFSRIDQLQTGDVLSVVTPCTTFEYTVDSHQVVQAGTAIFQTTAPRLVLTTCYPTDALFLTTQRYVLYASLDRVLATGAPTRTAPAAPVPTVPAPPALVAQGLDLNHNPAPLGALALTGTPTPAWQQSTAPLDDEAAVLRLYFAALRSASQDQTAWWADVAPGIPLGAAASLVGTQVTHNDVTFDPVLDVSGGTMVGASLTTAPDLSGGRAPGPYSVTMTAAVVSGNLVVTGWTMTGR